MKSFLNRIIFQTGSRTITDLYLLVILLLSSFLRLYHLDGRNIWSDEAFSIKFAELKVCQIFFLQENTPPLYWTVLHWWIQLFGTSESSVRLPSAIFGILSVLVMYKIGRLLFDVEAGRLSSLLLSISVFHISYSQEARTYSLSVLLTLLSMYFFLKVLKDMSRNNVIGYALSSILLLYSHIYGLFIIIAQNTYYVVLSFLSKESKQLNPRRWILIQCVIIALFVPWIGILLTAIHKVENGFWIPTPNINTIYLSFLTYSSESRKLLRVFIILSVLSAMVFEKRRGSLNWESFCESLEGYQWKRGFLNRDKVCFLLVWLMTPIILPFIISLFSQPIYYTRYTIVASAAFFLLVARGISNLRNRYIKVFIVIIIIVFSLMQVPRYYTEDNKCLAYKEQWRDVAKFVDTHFRIGDLLIFRDWGCVLPFDYYSRNDLIIKKGIDSLGHKDFFEIIRKEYEAKGSKSDIFLDEGNVDTLCKCVGQYDRIWLVLSHGAGRKEQIVETLTKCFDLSAQKEYKHIELYLFDHRTIPTRAGSH
ncbi:MAG: glycosyltransferase family 39 protein [Syntrophobacteraceae bacterium]